MFLLWFVTAVPVTWQLRYDFETAAILCAPYWIDQNFRNPTMKSNNDLNHESYFKKVKFYSLKVACYSKCGCHGNKK